MKTLLKLLMPNNISAVICFECGLHRGRFRWEQPGCRADWVPGIELCSSRRHASKRGKWHQVSGRILSGNNHHIIFEYGGITHNFIPVSNIGENHLACVSLQCFWSRAHRSKQQQQRWSHPKLCFSASSRVRSDTVDLRPEGQGLGRPAPHVS